MRGCDGVQHHGAGVTLRTLVQISLEGLTLNTYEKDTQLLVIQCFKITDKLLGHFQINAHII